MENNNLENTGENLPTPSHLFFPGNSMWLQRSKHGREKIFSSPQAMASTFGEYVDHLQAHPIITRKQVVVAQELVWAEEERYVPLTWAGFATFCGTHKNYFQNFRSRCSADFKEVIGQIDDFMFTQKFSGAASGIFNANIISRDLGLIDKKQLDARHLHASVAPMTPEEAAAANKALEDDF